MYFLSCFPSPNVDRLEGRSDLGGAGAGLSSLSSALLLLHELLAGNVEGNENAEPRLVLLRVRLPSLRGVDERDKP